MEVILLKKKQRRRLLPALLSLALAIFGFLWLQERGNGTYTVETFADGDVSSRHFESLAEARTYMERGGNRALLGPSGEVIDFTGTGIAVTPTDRVTNLYKDAAFKERQSYVAGGTRLRLVGKGSDHLRVTISGADVYVPLADMTLYPDAVVEKRGYYEMRDGQVLHTVEANGNLAGTFLVGPAPQETSDRFYTENVRDVFDSPYQFASIQSKSPYSARELDQFLATLGDSPLTGKGDAFKDAEAEFGINALFLLAVAGHESGYGTSAIARDKNNLFGFKATDDDPSGNASTFASIEASVDAAARLFAEKYVTGSYDRGPFPGNKQEGVNVFYASDPYWGEKVAGTMYRIDRKLGLNYLEQLQ
ncbi:lysozyme [Exiguobacterium sp. SH4S7]|nr:lysozyme [Exiguobacterium sp. SH4S7]TCI61371.1 lysozyme [Exiguobacterium sp. SH0S2]